MVPPDCGPPDGNAKIRRQWHESLLHHEVCDDTNEEGPTAQNSYNDPALATTPDTREQHSEGHDEGIIDVARGENPTIKSAISSSRHASSIHAENAKC